MNVPVQKFLWQSLKWILRRMCWPPLSLEDQRYVDLPDNISTSHHTHYTHTHTHKQTNRHNLDK